MRLVQYNIPKISINIFHFISSKNTPFRQMPFSPIPITLVHTCYDESNSQVLKIKQIKHGGILVTGEFATCHCQIISKKSTSGQICGQKLKNFRCTA